MDRTNHNEKSTAVEKQTERAYTSPFHSLRAEMDDLLANWFGRSAGLSERADPLRLSQIDLVPAVDVKANGSSYTITAELPGLTQDNVGVHVQDGMLVLSGEKSAETENKGDAQYISERSYGRFERRFRLPEDADPAKIAAKLKDGVMTIDIPRKAEAAAKAQKIKIN